MSVCFELTRAKVGTNNDIVNYLRTGNRDILGDSVLLDIFDNVAKELGVDRGLVKNVYNLYYDHIKDCIEECTETDKMIGVDVRIPFIGRISVNYKNMIMKNVQSNRKFNSVLLKIRKDLNYE